MRVALVAGEASGDILGASLMQALKAARPDIEFIGVGGPRMQAEGLQSYFPMERLAVMGLFEVLGRLPELLLRRRRLIRSLLEARPDVYIGIDAPDFNLGVELRLRRAGIRTVHYVSPSVWAWRQKRVLKIRQACDLMLTLFPFEAQFYEAQDVPVRFVGLSTDFLYVDKNGSLVIGESGFFDTTTGSTSSATNTARPGMRSMKICAMASPSSSSTGKAMAVKMAVCSTASHSRESANSMR